MGHSGADTHGRANELERAQVFLGRARHTLDDKGRVVMPSAYRAQLKEGVVATQGMEGQIAVVPVDIFQAFAEKEKETPRTRDARRQSRAVFTAAEHLKLDSQGRILLSIDMREYAGLVGANEVVVAGLYDHVEVWEPELFRQEQEISDRQYRDNEEAPGF
ncbi:MAG: division/cell wall cluster transcriptional repressor MraZ [Acidimicrobiia bacterium]